MAWKNSIKYDMERTIGRLGLTFGWTKGLLRVTVPAVDGYTLETWEREIIARLQRGGLTGYHGEKLYFKSEGAEAKRPRGAIRSRWIMLINTGYMCIKDKHLNWNDRSDIDQGCRCLYED